MTLTLKLMPMLMLILTADVLQQRDNFYDYDYDALCDHLAALTFLLFCCDKFSVLLHLQCCKGSCSYIKKRENIS